MSNKMKPGILAEIRESVRQQLDRPKMPSAIDWLVEKMCGEFTEQWADEIAAAQSMERANLLQAYMDGKFYEQQKGTPELSDDEIDKAATAYSAVNSINELELKDKYNDFIYAAKWYREQLKQRQCQ